MEKIRAYQVSIAFLVALLLVLNVIVPWQKNKQEQAKNTAMVELFQDLAGLPQSQWESRVADFNSSYNKSLALKADASLSASLCSIYTNMYIWHLMNGTDPYSAFIRDVERLINRYCSAPPEPVAPTGATPALLE